MKTLLEIINVVDPNGELLSTEQAIKIAELYLEQWKKENLHPVVLQDPYSPTAK